MICIPYQKRVKLRERAHAEKENPTGSSLLIERCRMHNIFKVGLEPRNVTLFLKNIIGLLPLNRNITLTLNCMLDDMDFMSMLKSEISLEKYRTRKKITDIQGSQQAVPVLEKERMDPYPGINRTETLQGL